MQKLINFIIVFAIAFAAYSLLGYLFSGGCSQSDALAGLC